MCAKKGYVQHCIAYGIPAWSQRLWFWCGFEEVWMEVGQPCINVDLTLGRANNAETFQAKLKTLSFKRYYLLINVNYLLLPYIFYKFMSVHVKHHWSIARLALY